SRGPPPPASPRARPPWRAAAPARCRRTTARWPGRSPRSCLVPFAVLEARDGPGLEQLVELVLGEDRAAELPRPGLLGAGVVADDDPVGLLAHGTRGPAAALEDRLLRAVAGVALERARDDDGEALEGRDEGGVPVVLHAHPVGGPPVDDLPVPRVVLAVEPLPHRRRDRRADALDVRQLLLGGRADRRHRAE